MSQWFTGLADACRETGYPVIEVPGWKTRGHGPMASHVYGIVDHHTAGPEPERTSSNYPSLNVVTNGYAGLPGPLSNLGLGYDGTIYVIAAGLCYHAGAGSWRGVSGNGYFLGIEAEDGGDGDWMPAQLDCYPRLNAVLCQFLGATAGWVVGHKEYATPPGRKIDPAGIAMDQMRQKTAYYLNHPREIRKQDEMANYTDDDHRIIQMLGRLFNPENPKTDKSEVGWVRGQINETNHQVSLILGLTRNIAQQIGGIELDEQAIIRGVLSGLAAKLTPQQIAAEVAEVLPPALAREVIVELGNLIPRES